jgi:dTMP kinase
VRLVHPHRRPDLTVLLDAPVEIGMRRASTRNGSEGPDRFESERSDFFERVRGCYLQRAAHEPKRFRVIDASLAPDDVEARVRQALAGLLESAETAS